MGEFKKRIRFGIKVYTIAISILLLLIILSWVTYAKAGKVSDELKEIAEYLIPLEDLIANIDVHAIEQELHLERVWRLYEIKPVDLKHIAQEKSLFEIRGNQVDNEIAQALKLADQAIEHLDIKKDLLEFAHIKTVLEDVEKEHQDYHDHALKIIKAIENHEIDKAHVLQNVLEDEEDQLGLELNEILLEIEEFTENSAKTTEAHEKNVLLITTILVVISVLVGLLYASVMSFNLMRPVNKLVKGTKELEKGNLGVNIPITTNDEIGEMTDFFNKMTQEIREKEHIKTTFGQFLDPRIVDELLHRNAPSMEKGQKKTMTVFHSDVADFSLISEMLTPGGLVNLINNYLTLASEPITRNYGVIDQYIGDAVVAFWGEPFTNASEHALLACDAALEQFVQLEKLRKRLPDLMGIRKGLPELKIRIGLATGPLLAGNIGSEEMQSYTVMGEAVGMAEILEGTNKKFGTNILISQETQDLVKDGFETREVGMIKVLDKQNVSIFELLDRKGECDIQILELKEYFEKGLALYHSKDLSGAKNQFKKCLEIKSDDKPTRIYLNKIDTLGKN
ncbi:MAG: HAMP domain-containing protein [Spirochaetes bacterium]|nr:HAMP domain-containing protein [Spirochaetota bacterium]